MKQSEDNKDKSGGNLGFWASDTVGLPAYHFTAKLPLETRKPDGTPARVPNDPWFLIGNDGLKLFAHASGQIQWMTGDRHWARFNGTKLPNRGGSGLRVRVGNDPHSPAHDLCVPAESSPHTTQKSFGCGFCEWKHALPEGLNISHRIECPPTVKSPLRPNLWVETITLQNHSGTALICGLDRFMDFDYVPAMLQRTPREKWPVRYKSNARADGKGADILFSALPTTPASIPVPPEEGSVVEWHPHHVRLEFLKIPDSFATRILPLESGDRVQISGMVGIPVGATVTFQWAWVAGDQRQASESRSALAHDTISEIAEWRKQWAEAVTDFPGESDAVLRREMRWHVGMLLSMATASSVYHERFMPQGTSYEFDIGITCSARDHLQHALPLCHTSTLAGPRISSARLPQDVCNWRNSPDGKRAGVNDDLVFQHQRPAAFFLRFACGISRDHRRCESSYTGAAVLAAKRALNARHRARTHRARISFPDGRSRQGS